MNWESDFQQSDITEDYSFLKKLDRLIEILDSIDTNLYDIRRAIEVNK